MSARMDRTFWIWLGLILYILACVFLSRDIDWLKSYPEALVLPVAPVMNNGMVALVDSFGSVFRAISWAMTWPFTWIQQLFHWLPWPVTMALVAIVAHAAQGYRLVIFALISMSYMLITGYWYQSMNSLTLVAISVPLAILVGFGFGVWGFYSKRAERVMMPTLDLLQTVPAFAYLIPILLLFGFGPVVGVIASLLFSFPPMVRNTVLGLRGVSAVVIESGLMSGATRAQLFWQVRLPSAQRQILLGVNQATMASLSMVIVASIIGGTDDIGWEVLSTMRKALFGESLLAGIVIALIAMLMDRITWGLAIRESEYNNEEPPTWRQRHRHWIVAGVAFVALFSLSAIVPALHKYPEAWQYNPAQYLNDAINYIIINYREVIETIKTVSFFYLMLPTRIGLEQTVSPYTWGFEMTAAFTFGYVALFIGLMGAAFHYISSRAAIAVALFGTIYYFGLTNIPWLAMTVVFIFLGWRLGGWKLALGTSLGLAFLLLTGSWEVAVLSLYMCGLAVIVSFVLGGAIGIWAAHNDRVSAIVRPINDTLQTMPLFVLLIPVVMLFKIGEFTALIAIVAYAIVPAVRYVEHGLRDLPEDVIEAATAMGCTGRQLLFQVKLPLALPIIMLGLNQTIMYAIAMLVIAALVGTNDLGQQVYIGLGDGDFGVGMIAGFGMAIIAMIADRMTQGWSKGKRQELGIS
ncbi:MAG: ABC transporter permease subunit [Rhodospirillaceae bacterium]|nr:ABC transporter permease subunit [Rhodospirillaceae bacterium]